MVFYLGLRIFGVLLFISSTYGDNLVAIHVETKLPEPSYLMASYYDGKSDFIYLMGGTNGTTNHSSILRFNIYTETIEDIASLPRPSYGSPLEADFNGNLYYFHSPYSPYEVYKYNIVNNSVETVGELLVNPNQSASTKNSAGNVIIMGGYVYTDIMEIDVHSETVSSQVVGQFPLNTTSAIAVQVSNNRALVFGSGYFENFTYLEYDLNTLEAKDVAQSSFPKFEYGITATSDGKYVYLFGGGFRYLSGNNGLGIIRLDITTHSWESLTVQDFPATPDWRFQNGPSVVWVEKLNRIYLFGGRLGGKDFSYLHLNDIYYIDLNSQSPTTELVQ